MAQRNYSFEKRQKELAKKKKKQEKLKKKQLRKAEGDEASDTGEAHDPSASGE